MDLDDLEELATKLHGKGSHWDLFQTAAGAGLVLYAAWAGSLALGIRKVFVQVLEAYKQGFRPVVGYELNRLLWQLSHFRAWRAGCYGKVFFRREDFWKADLSDCSNLTVFLAPSVQVPLLERKLLSKLPDEACVVAARFPFTWTPSRDAGESLERAWAYNIKDVRQAKQDTAGGGPAKE
ncbi:adenine nucleotide translocase lysine N-methyltransferase-like isoform X3 [Sceloporus undulatus]|uniref:adenine nucleotide translocase lysine N-methyltransferase-like isoform X3 n=1 Tax=Sceloporus undulatus TaxID=8520 RepID=UPI001C4AF9BB|nr:adenine nucleotide translocase lysine N-methyltransferase-like isoform X3 [Sceloporus undulatus]